MVAFAVFGILYGACMALVQRDFWRLLAFAALSHLSLIVLGIYGLTFTGSAGAIYQILNHGVVDGALFVLLGVLYDRYATSQIGAYGGLASKLPRTATLFVITSLAMMGLPLLNNFVGEFLILPSTFSGVSRGWTVAASLGVILGAAYMLWLVQRIFYGPQSEMATTKPAIDLRLPELAVLWPLAVLMLIMGVAPSLWLPAIEDAVRPRLQQPQYVDILQAPAPSELEAHSESCSRHLPHSSRSHPHADWRGRDADRRLACPGVSAPPVGLGSGHWNHTRAVGQPLAAFLAARHGLFVHVRNQRLHHFFHVLICGIVLVALLLSLDTLPEDSHHQGEYTRLSFSAR